MAAAEPDTGPALRAYYESVLDMLVRISRDAKGAQPAIDRTSDIVQEVFLRLGPQLRSQEPAASLVPLAATIARRWLIDRARQRRRDAAIPEALLAGAEQSLHDLGIDPLDLEQFLIDLSPRQRSVLDLRLFAGLEHREIQESLGETEYFVRQTLKLARERLLRLKS